MRHVQRTHRIDLDWLFERLRDDNAISMRYVNTKQQLADILTKGSFSETLWNQLTKLALIQKDVHVHAKELEEEIYE